jgi:uridine phosphorylase
MTTTVHHLEVGTKELAGNDGLGRYVFLPGSTPRAARIGRRFKETKTLNNRRGLDVQLGFLERDGLRVDAAAVPTGMGCPSVDIIVGELLQLGVRRFLRVGTAGTLQKQIRSGDLVVASGAVRDEGTSDAYAPREFPAVADPVMAEVLCSAAVRIGLGERTHCGVVHSKDSFFGREFAAGHDSERNRAYMELLARNRVLASEMETAHLFVLGAVANAGRTTVNASRTREVGVRCGAIMAVVGDSSGFAALDVEQAAEERLIDLAVEGILDMAELERTP